jgi:hypothetical protein
MFTLLDWVPHKKLDWNTLSGNPNAVHVLEQNLDKVNWLFLSGNPNAVHLLEKNVKKVDWFYISLLHLVPPRNLRTRCITTFLTFRMRVRLYLKPARVDETVNTDRHPCGR